MKKENNKTLIFFTKRIISYMVIFLVFTLLFFTLLVNSNNIGTLSNEDIIDQNENTNNQVVNSNEDILPDYKLSRDDTSIVEGSVTTEGFDVLTIMNVVEEGTTSPFPARFINFIVTSGSTESEEILIGKSIKFGTTASHSPPIVFDEPFTFHIPFESGLSGGVRYDNLNFKVDIEMGGGVDDWTWTYLSVLKPSILPPSLTTPIVSDIDKNSAKVTTTVGGDRKLSRYYLNVEKANGTDIIWSTEFFDDSGTKVIEIKNLEMNTEYKDFYIYVYDENGARTGVSSTSFSFKTKGKDIGDLSTPRATNISSTTATIEVTVGQEQSFFDSNGKYNSYFLDVKNSSGESLGKSGKLEDVGKQSIQLTELTLGKDYINCVVIAYDSQDEGEETPLKTSKTFSFSTLKKQPLSLTQPTVSNLTKTSATITTTVSEGETYNGDYYDYVLDVQDSSGVSLGKSTTFSDEGEKIIELTELTLATEYSDCVIVAKDPVDDLKVFSQSSPFTFTTLKKIPNNLTLPIVSDVTKTTATVETNVSEEVPSINNGGVFDNYVLDVQDSVGTSLGKSTTLSDGGKKSIELTELASGTKYNDCKIIAYSEGDEELLYAESPKFNFTTLKKNPNSLSLPIVSDVKKTTATVTTDVTDDSLNGEFQDYVLSVKDNSSGLILGESTTQSSGGSVSIYLTDLTIATKYDDCVIIAHDPEDITTIYATSLKFSFETASNVVGSLIDPSVIDIEKTTANVQINVVSDSEDLENVELSGYKLMVKDEHDNSYGETGELTDSGLQIINLSSLTPNHKYDNFYVVAVSFEDEESVFAKSSNFNFETAKDSIYKLENTEVSVDGYDSATISVDALTEDGKSEDSPIVVNNYTLVVTDTLTGDVWEKGEISTTGNKEIKIDKLEWNHVYNDGDLIVTVKGTNISSEVGSFETQGEPISIEPDSFNVNKKSVTSNSFKFSINLDINDEFKSFDPEIDLVLFSRGKELNIKFIGSNNLNDNGTTTYTYFVKNLKSNYKYKDFKLKIKQSPFETPINNKITIRTKKSLAFTIVMSIIVVATILMLIFVVLIFVKQFIYGSNQDYYGGGSIRTSIKF